MNMIRRHAVLICIAYIPVVYFILFIGLILFSIILFFFLTKDALCHFPNFVLRFPVAFLLLIGAQLCARM